MVRRAQDDAVRGGDKLKKEEPSKRPDRPALASYIVLHRVSDSGGLFPRSCKSTNHKNHKNIRQEKYIVLL